MTEIGDMTAEALRDEVRYLRWLVWKLSLPGLWEQTIGDDRTKYARWMRRTYSEDRESPGLHSFSFGERRAT